MLSLKESSNCRTESATKGAEATHELILRSALGEFSRKGFLGTTTRDIAAAAGVAEVTLFRHFASKERLFEETIARYSFVAQLKPILETIESLPYREAVATLANRLLDTMLNYKDWIVIFHSEVRRSPDTVARMYHGFLDQLYGELAGFFRQRQERGEVRGVDPYLAARALHGIVFSFFHVHEVLGRKQHDVSSRETAIDGFVDLICHGTYAIAPHTA